MEYRGRIFAFFIFVLFFQGYDSIQCQCPNKWITYKGSCYWFGTNGKNFWDATNYCKSHGAQLAQIGSMEENAFLKDYVSRLTGNRFWIGLTDLAREGVWKWQDPNVSYVFKDWAPNEPNAWGPDDDCASMAQDYNRQWIDEWCGMKYLTICEKTGNSV